MTRCIHYGSGEGRDLVGVRYPDDRAGCDEQGMGEITTTQQGDFRFSLPLLRLAPGYHCRLFLAKEDERLWEGPIY